MHRRRGCCMEGQGYSAAQCCHCPQAQHQARPPVRRDSHGSDGQDDAPLYPELSPSSRPDLIQLLTLIKMVLDRSQDEEKRKQEEEEERKQQEEEEKAQQPKELDGADRGGVGQCMAWWAQHTAPQEQQTASHLSVARMPPPAPVPPLHARGALIAPSPSCQGCNSSARLSCPASFERRWTRAHMATTQATPLEPVCTPSPLVHRLQPGP